MKKIRIILLGIAMALFAVNFWAIDYRDLAGRENMWAYFRIMMAFILVIFLLRMIRKDRKIDKGNI